MVRASALLDGRDRAFVSGFSIQVAMKRMSSKTPFFCLEAAKLRAELLLLGLDLALEALRALLLDLALERVLLLSKI